MVYWRIQKCRSIALCVLLMAAMSAALNYTDAINCTDSDAGANITRTEVLSHGQCVTYTGGNPCDVYYTVGEDRVYIPFGRARNNVEDINFLAEQADIIIKGVQQPCREAATRLVCYYYYPPCGNSTHFLPPNSVCQEQCTYVTEDLCLEVWPDILEHFEVESVRGAVTFLNLPFINCTDPGFPLGQLPHCCSDAGIEFVQLETTTQGHQPISTDSEGPNLTVIIPSSVVAAVSILIVIVVILITTCVCVRRSTAKVVLQVTGDNIVLGNHPEVKPGSGLPRISISPEGGTSPSTPRPRYIVNNPDGVSDVPLSPSTPGMQPHRARVASTYIRQMDSERLLIPGRHIKLLDCIGKGEFGVVYRGHLTGWERRTTPELVAVKTLKSLFSLKEIEDIMEESLKMKSFRHPNVLNLIGVCIDAGEAPYIVMPYMANGSLLAYLRKERPNLTIAEKASEDVTIPAKKQLLSICLQIAKGMEYLASKKFVHRDLAARNCMIDSGFVIKVADFGLSEDIYARNYFKQGKLKDDVDVKLPIRWMAVESLLDGIFTQKTDVWSYGVTCWEVFSLGRTPYPAVDPFTLIKYLEGGQRLDKPSNAACSTDIYDIMTACWNHIPDERPSFSDVVISINTLLEGVAGYLDFSAISRHTDTAGGEGYDRLVRRDYFDGRYDRLMDSEQGRSSDSVDENT